LLWLSDDEPLLADVVGEVCDPLGFRADLLPARLREEGRAGKLVAVPGQALDSLAVADGVQRVL
jgi:hypothetical protein